METLLPDPVARALAGAFAAFAISALILRALIATGLAWRLAMDIPNERSLHSLPTPRVGGWGVVPTVVVLTLFAAPGLWLPVLAAALLAGLSQIDDRRGLPVRVRFGGHVAAVAALIAFHPAPVSPWGLVVIGFLMVWLVNLYNFMDGSDGLAGGMAVFGFGGYAVAALTSAHPDHGLALVSAMVAGAAGGFLLFNFHPARIFLGDAGSIPLGYLAGAAGYWGWAGGVWPIWLPPMLFAPFIADASVTLLRRLVRGEKVWEAHREHYYQRMVQAGLGHATTAWIWYALMAVGIMYALAVRRFSPAGQWGAVVAWMIVLLLAGCFVDAWCRRVSRSG